MNNTQQRDVLLGQANKACLTMMQGIGELLEIADRWIHEVEIESSATALKAEDVTSTIESLTSLSKGLAGEVIRWAKHEPRIISKMGVELDLLNELYANVDALFTFFHREEIDVPVFDILKIKQAHADLIRCNRLL